jgi:hypothetical protein
VRFVLVVLNFPASAGTANSDTLTSLKARIVSSRLVVGFYGTQERTPKGLPQV